MRPSIKILVWIMLSTVCTGNICVAQNDKLIIYQLLPRLFGNKQTNNIPYGTIEQNGSGKFNDINDKALDGIKELGITHIWYTGVLAHGSLTDYSAFGIKPDDADVVKGRAGSPYAIRDYYDVDPDLAVDVRNRMTEFEELLTRTHKKELKVIIDFVPNHVARNYHSLVKPAGVEDFGAKDDITKDFDSLNDYYYVPGKPFVVPTSQNANQDSLGILKDNKFIEMPAKATGNNVFYEAPKKDDWYETVKLNYGVDYNNGKKNHFNPIPPVWIKMRDILKYWASKGVDGFRCDVAEMVPVEFWHWVIPEVKAVNPKLIFIGEAYNPKVYKDYLTTGNFDYLYDKVGLYDSLKKLIKNEPSGNVAEINKVWQVESAGFGDKMLRFLENHDEERIASGGFAGNPTYAIPAMVISATLSGGPVMLYFGQEVGEPAKGIEGFGGDDNRTTIFDYWGVPEHQKWMNNGEFDGAGLSAEQYKLRGFYKQLMQIAGSSDAIINGNVTEILTNNKKVYAYVRYNEKQRLLIIANFNRTKSFNKTITIPKSVLAEKTISTVKELLSGATPDKNASNEIAVKIMPSSAQIIEF